MRVHLTQEDTAQPGSSAPLEYDVLGLPPGQTVWIRDFAGDGWQVLRIRSGVSGQWEGHYSTAEEALADLERGGH